MNRRFLAVSAMLLFLTTATGEPVCAQGVIVYGPLQPQYQLGSFLYQPPMKDGWRQVTSEPSAMRLVYVESLGTDKLNTRADLVAEAFPIPAPELITSGLQLTSSGLSQQMDQRGELLVGYTRIEELAAKLETHAYTLSIKLGAERKRYETFFVVLAPDKREYLVAKLTIDEEDYNTRPFFTHVYESMKEIGYAGATDKDEAPSAEAGEPLTDEDASSSEREPSATSEQPVSAP